MRPIVQHLLFIIARPARLLECIEFDPKEFYKLLEAAENNLRNVQTDVPKYIISKLGLDKDLYGKCEDAESTLMVLMNSDIGSEELNTSLELNLSVDIENASSKNEKNRVNSCTSHDFHNQKDNSLEMSFLKPLAPKESDFEDIKLISNGAYG